MPDTTTLLDEILDALTEDGDEFELPDGRTLKLRIEQDEITSVRDFECWGEFSKYDYDYWHDGHTQRPDGFDGNAEKIEHAPGYWCWWQPPRGDYAWVDPETNEPAKRGSKAFNELRQTVRDLLEIGFVCIGVEIHDGEDAYHRPIVVGAEWIGGVEWNVDKAYLRSLISDHLYELEVV